MYSYFVALEPEEKLGNLLNDQKRIIGNLVGEQKYLSNPPNITLFPLTIRDIEKIIEVLEKIAMSTQKIHLKLEYFNIFYNDIRTGGNTITYPFSEESVEKLKQIQLRAIMAVNEFNEKRFLTKDSEIYGKMSEIERKNTVEYGYPFIGKNWIPHITLASIEKNRFDETWSKLKESPIKGQFLIESINLYESPMNPRLIRKFKLP